MARAHALDEALIDISPLGPERWMVHWAVPDAQGQPMALTLSLPPGCTPDTGPAPTRQAAFWVSRWSVACPDGIGGLPIGIAGLEVAQTEATLRFHLDSARRGIARLRPDAPHFLLPARPEPLTLLQTHLGLGLTYVMTTWSYLAAPIALALLIGPGAPLLQAMAAGLFAQALVMWGVFLTGLSLPQIPTRTVLALSVMFLALALLRGRDSYVWRRSGTVAFGTGALSGLCFAADIQHGASPLESSVHAMLGLTLGVTAGQIAFGLAALMLSYGLGLMLRPRLVEATTAYILGAVAACWVIDGLARSVFGAT